MRKPDKYIKAVEASKFLELTITEFLDMNKKGLIPKSHFMGRGQRWLLTELEEWKNGKR